MSDDTDRSHAGDSSWLRREAVIDRFEAAWQEHGDADPAAFLPAPGAAERRDLLCELVKIDLEYRWERGQQVRVEDYCRRFPELAGQGPLPVELVLEEVRVRQFHGCPPTADELRERFPDRAAELLDRTSLLSPRPRPGRGEPPTLSGLETGPARRAAAGPEVPRWLGRYEVREQVGRGGFSSVYRAWDPELRREVALKVPRAEFVGDPDGRARMLREAHSAARLRHPAIVSLHEAGQDGDTAYLVYDFISGPTLAHELRQTHPAPEQAAAWVARVAEALDYAHRAGIVHRDVKPANIMMDRDGLPLLADFGLALHADAGATLTQQGEVLGTPAYMSPEQARGDSHHVDARSDVYSLGVVLYELLTGRLPFEGQTSTLLLRVLREEPPPPRQHRPEVPRDLETICLKAMAKEPARRYPSAGELAADLRRYLEHLPIRARRLGPVGRLVLWARRNPALAATLTAAVLVIGTVAGVGFWRVVAEREQFRRQRDQANANLYRALTGEAHSLTQSRETGWWWQAMDNVREAAQLDVPGRDTAELRDLAIQLMGSGYPCLRLHKTLEGHTGPVTAVAIHLDGRIIASGGRDQTIRLWSLPEGQLLAVLRGHTSTITGLAFHPDGRHLASGGGDGTVRWWDVTTPDAQRRPVRTWELKGGPVHGIDLSPDGAWLAAACADGKARLLRADERASEPWLVLAGHTAAVTCVAFTRQGDQVATGSDDRTIRFWDLDTGKLATTWGLGNGASKLCFPQMQADFLAWTSPEWFGFEVRDAVKGGVFTHWQNLHTSSVSQIRWDQRHQRWLTASADGTLKLMRLKFNPNFESSREDAVARAQFGGAFAAALSPGCDWVAAGYQDGKVGLWELAEPPQRHQINTSSPSDVFIGGTWRLVNAQNSFEFTDQGGWPPGKLYWPAPPAALAIDRAGKRFAFSRDDGRLHVWDLEGRRELRRWQAHERRVSALCGSPDGTRLASASADGTVRLWSWDTGRLERTLEAGVGPLSTAAWSGDGRFVAAGIRGAALWDLQDDGSARRLGEGTPGAAAVALGAGLVASSGAGGTVEVRDLPSGQLRHSLRGPADAVLALEFGPDGQTLAAGARNGNLRLWNALRGEASADLQLSGGSITGLTFDSRGRYLVSTTGRDAIFWDVRSRRESAGIYQGAVSARFLPDDSGVLLGDGRGGVFRCAVAEVERARAAAGNPNSVVRVDAVTPVVPGGHALPVWGMAASLDGRWVATASHDQTVKLWDARTMTLARTLEGHGNIVWCVVFSPDSKLVASGSASADARGGEVRVWEAATGREVHRFRGHQALVRGVAFHPQRPWLASSAGDGTVHLWDLEAGKGLGLLHRFDQAAYGLAFRPDGAWLAVACNDRRVALWDLAQPLQPPAAPTRFLTGHNGAVWSVAYSPDGRTLASGAQQGLVLLHDANSFERAAALRADTGEVRGLSYSSDGRFLAVSAFSPSTTVVWDLPHLRRSLADMGLDW